ncbi:protein DMP4-like [Cocos nucifera]|uniref:Protein DMP4-like n=1 Tax=Cocos nucifera TaxID=13894 RepID=A0A8K0IB91_COCNU|nr:protein DMP4-like [Cocos nucifera]
MIASKMADEEAQLQQQQPLLIPKSSDDDRRILIQKAISQTFKSTAHLANLLPTGTVLAFQLLSPIFTNQGHCDPMSQFMTAALVALCGLSCLFQSFTDSFRDRSGKVRYGLATFGGLWVIDGTAPLPPEMAINYRIKFIDFVHAFMSILVFAAVALFDQSVVSCFYPNPSEEMKQVLTSLPIGIGVFGSMLFVTFPTTRHGIGFPLSSS